MEPDPGLLLGLDGEAEMSNALCVICCQDRDKSYAEYFAEEDRPAGKAEGTCHLCWGPSLVDSYYPPFPELCFTKVWEMEGEIDD